MRTYFLLCILHYWLPVKIDFPILTATVYKELHSSNPCSVLYPHSSTISIWPLQYYTYSKEPGNEASIRIYVCWNWGWGYSTSTTTSAPIRRSVRVHIIFDCLERLSWFRVLDHSYIPFRSAPLRKLVPIHCWQCTSPHHDDDHKQLASNCSVYNPTLYISVIWEGM